MTTAEDQPRDRPPLSQSIEAAFGIAWLYLFWLGTLAFTIVAVAGSLVPAADQSGALLLGLLTLAVVPMITVVLGLRVGKRWALRLMRVMAVVAGCIWVGDVMIGLQVASGRMGIAGFPAGNYTAENTGRFFLFVAALLVIPAALLIRSFRRVRWLDPRSRPSEWEKPMRSAARIRTGRW